MNLSPEKISKFWNWFKTVSADLLINPTDTYFINLLDREITKLGNVDWEIGPWEENIMFLALSPNLNIDQLELTQQIVSSAPDCPGWKFLPSKPPKNWQGTWKMENEFGKSILIDASEWKYILYRFDDGTFDIDINIADFDGNKTTQYMAVDIALTGYLGEEAFMNLIQEISIVDEFSEELLSKATSLKNIKNHVDQITQ